LGEGRENGSASAFGVELGSTEWRIGSQRLGENLTSNCVDRGEATWPSRVEACLIVAL